MSSLGHGTILTNDPPQPSSGQYVLCSRQLDVLRAVLVIAVLWIHAYAVNGSPSTASEWMQYIISQQVGRIAIPGLFLLSGLLFFRAGWQGHRWFAHKIMRRARTLLVPYVVWGTLCMVGGYLISRSPWSWCVRRPIAEYTLVDLAVGAVWSNPIAYHLWFLRDLFLLCLLSPLLCILVAPLRLVTSICLGAIWFMGVDVPVLGGEGGFFFTSGAFLAMAQVQLARHIGTWHRLWAVLWLAIVALELVAVQNHWYGVRALHDLGLIVGLASVWANVDILDALLRHRVFAHLVKYGFFIYLVHEPVLTVMKKLCLRHIGATPGGLALCYYGAPLMTIAVAGVLGFLLRRVLPRLYAVLSGARESGTSHAIPRPFDGGIRDV